jgi:hypothetical protein
VITQFFSEDIMLDSKMAARLACCLVLALSAAPVAAQQHTSPSARRNQGDLDKIRMVSTLIGTEVLNQSNAKVAVVRDLALSPEGAVLYAILGYGGVAGVGDTYTAAPFDALWIHHDNEKWAVNLNMTSEEIKNTPTIRSEDYRELSDAQWIERTDRFFRPHFETQADSQRRGEPTAGVRRTMEHVLLATKIRAAKLKNTRNEELGKVEDLLLDGRHHVVFVIIGQGGVLGIGENYIPVPWSKLSFNINRENLAVLAMIECSKVELEKAPIVKGTNYATLLAPGFADQVRQYFGVPRTETQSRAGERQ